MKKVLLFIWLGMLFLAIIGLFWRMDWVYKLPTPVPEDYVAVRPGQRIDIASTVNLTNGRPVLVHFFNPDCPCSKFNVAHFRSLVQLYSNKVNFVIVPLSKEPHTVKEIQAFYDLKIPVLFDTSLAKKCGVYSTPQAVIIDSNQKLYYRGNYNKSRYCTDKKTEYALMALDSLLDRKMNPLFDQYALTAYGCTIPGQK